MERFNIGVNPGDFRHTVTLLTPVAGTDAGGVTTTYQPGSPAVFIYAKIEYLRGAEVIKGGLDTTQAWVKITSYFNAAFTAGKRVQLPKGNQAIIQFMDNVREMDAYMEITGLVIGVNN